MSFTKPLLLSKCSFKTALPCSYGYHLEKGGMPLHDAIKINCKKGANTENQGAGGKYMGQGHFSCTFLTWVSFSDFYMG